MDVSARKGENRFGNKNPNDVSSHSHYLNAVMDWPAWNAARPNSSTRSSHFPYGVSSGGDALRLTEANGLFCAAARTFSSWMWV